MSRGTADRGYLRGVKIDPKKRKCACGNRKFSGDAKCTVCTHPDRVAAMRTNADEISEARRARFAK